MKTFRCGDVIPNCAATFAGTETQILAAVGDHARQDHGVTDLTPELVGAVRSRLHLVNA